MKLTSKIITQNHSFGSNLKTLSKCVWISCLQPPRKTTHMTKNQSYNRTHNGATYIVYVVFIKSHNILICISHILLLYKFFDGEKICRNHPNVHVCIASLFHINPIMANEQMTAFIHVFLISVWLNRFMVLWFEITDLDYIPSWFENIIIADKLTHNANFVSD